MARMSKKEKARIDAQIQQGDQIAQQYAKLYVTNPYASPITEVPDKPKDIDKFAGIEFAAGEIYGVRSWDLDALGRLRSVYYTSYVWKPGENVARCLTGADAVSTWSVVWGGPPAEKPMKPKHDIDIVNCACGFYAYTQPHINQYRDPTRIQGIIKGYGVTQIGTHGFRSEKAEVVAAAIPTKGDKPNAFYTDMLERLYGLKVFADEDEMLGEYDIDQTPHRLTPETDPDFWERP